MSVSLDVPSDAGSARDGHVQISSVILAVVLFATSPIFWLFIGKPSVTWKSKRNLSHVQLTSCCNVGVPAVGSDGGTDPD